MANCKNREWYSSDEDDVKCKPKKAKVISDAEEGELSSDNCDELDLEKLFKDEDERNRVLRMTEKEREVEIFKRSVELNDFKSRQKAYKKLNEQKKKQSNQRPINKKRSLAEVFSRCSSEDESVHSSSNESTKRFVEDNSVPKKKSKSSPQPYGRQRALDNQKRSQIDMLSKLNENRKQRKEKAEKSHKEEIQKKAALDSDSSDLEEKNIDNVDRQSIISSSSSEHMNEAEPEEDKFVETLEQLSKIKLSRHKLEKWVHMPFFKDLVKGCFVRVNIGEGPSVLPIYRCAEITEVVETVKIYDIGQSRTNIGLKLRIGKSVTMFRLIFVSNQEFLPAEFDSWRRRVLSDGTPLPKLSFIEEKVRQIQEYSNFSINDEETMNKVILSKQRFKNGPVNFALHKAELTRMKLSAENDGDQEKAHKLQDEIDELNMKAEKLERKRTVSIKNISYINQRNREITQNHVEKAIELEIEENREWEKIGGDPFLREPTKPVLNYRKKKQQMLEKAALDAMDKVEKTEPSGATDPPKDTIPKIKSELPPTPRPTSASLAEEDSKINISKIHNFELNLDIKEEHPLNQHHYHHQHDALSEIDSKIDIEDSIFHAITSSLIGSSNASNSSIGGVSGDGSGVVSSSNSQSSSSRRVLNLQDYKRRKGLI